METPTNIVKFLIRRGTNSARKQVVLAQGEIGMTTDQNSVRLFVGDGATPGGLPAASKFYLIKDWADALLQYVETNDMVFNVLTNHLYALTGSNTGSMAISALSAEFVYIGK